MNKSAVQIGYEVGLEFYGTHTRKDYIPRRGDEYILHSQEHNFNVIFYVIPKISSYMAITSIGTSIFDSEVEVYQVAYERAKCYWRQLVGDDNLALYVH